MLDQILPVQYVDGLNTFGDARNSAQGIIVEWEQSVAIPYSPRATYALSALEMSIGYDANSTLRGSVLLADGEKPSEIVLSSGSPVEGGSKRYLRFDMTPVVLVRDASYFVVLSVTQGRARMPIIDGARSPLVWKLNAHWGEGQVKECTPMLRFYGRLLPKLD